MKSHSLSWLTSEYFICFILSKKHTKININPLSFSVVKYAKSKEPGPIQNNDKFGLYIEILLYEKKMFPWSKGTLKETLEKTMLSFKGFCAFKWEEKWVFVINPIFSFV